MKILPQSLYKRLLLTITASVIAVISILGSFQAFTLGQQAIHNAMNETQLMAETSASALSSAFIVRNYDAMEQFLIQLAKQEKVKTIKVVNLQGMVLIGIDKNNANEAEINYGKQEILPPVDLFAAQMTDNKIIVWAPMMAGKIVAWVKLEQSIDYIRSFQREILINTAVTALILMFVVEFFVALLLKKIVLQIKQTARFAGRLPKNTAAQLKITPASSEVEHLISALNTTSKQLYDQNIEVQMLHSLINYSNEPVFILDPEDDFRMYFANKAACIHFGTSLNQLLKSTILDWNPTLDDTSLLKLWQDIKRSRYKLFETKHRKADGAIVPVEVSANYLFYRNKEYIAGYFRNISERKQVETLLKNHRNMLLKEVRRQTFDLEKAKNEAVLANQSKSEFLANMSHELRTPLHGILSFAQLGLKRIDQADLPKLESYFERIEVSGQRLLLLLNDLLDLSKLEAGKIQLEIEQHDLTTIVENCALELSASMNQKQITWQWENDNTAQLAEFDQTSITKVVSNLFSNAIKFSQPEQTITVDISETELTSDDLKTSGLMLSLSDQGVGVPENELSTIFDKFIQSSKTKTNAGGTGLGLAICKEIISAHHGVIWAENREEGGLTVKFIIPIKTPSSP